MCQNAARAVCLLVSIRIRLLEVGLAVLRVGDHRGLAGLPASRADLSVLVSVLEGLDQPQGLVHGPSHRQIVHGDLSEDTLVVNDEQSSQGVAVILQIDSVI